MDEGRMATLLLFISCVYTNPISTNQKGPFLKYYCGKDLTKALQMVCYDPNYFRVAETGLELSNNVKGGEASSKKAVVDACCRNPCSMNTLRTYCPADLAILDNLKPHEYVKDFSPETTVRPRSTTEISNFIRSTTSSVLQKNKVRKARERRRRRGEELPMLMRCMYRRYSNYLLRTRRTMNSQWDGKITKAPKPSKIVWPYEVVTARRICENCETPITQ